MEKKGSAYDWDAVVAEARRKREGMLRAIEVLLRVPSALFVVGEIFPDFKAGKVALKVAQKHNELLEQMRDDPSVRRVGSSVELADADDYNDGGEKVGCACALGQLGLEDEVIGTILRDAYRKTLAERGPLPILSRTSSLRSNSLEAMKRIRSSWESFRITWDQHFNVLCEAQFGPVPNDLKGDIAGNRGRWHYYNAVAFRYGLSAEETTAIYKYNDECGGRCWETRTPDEVGLDVDLINKTWHRFSGDVALSDLRQKRHAKLGVLGALKGMADLQLKVEEGAVKHIRLHPYGDPHSDPFRYLGSLDDVVKAGFLLVNERGVPV